MNEKRKILFIGEGGVSDDIRCQLPATELVQMNYAETAYIRLTPYNQRQVTVLDCDAVVFSRPHHDTLLTAYKRAGIPVIVDMDDDFHAIPENHPGYKYVGKGDPFYLMQMENCLWLADHLIVTTEVLRTRLTAFNDHISVIPNGWTSSNPHWLAKRITHQDRLIYGWGGTITHREDFRMVVEPLKKLLRNYPKTMVAIAGDYEIYNMLTIIPDSQKLFMPMVSYSQYPITLSYWDVLLAPLLDTEFNQAKSDIKLVDAGARSIPFIASCIKPYLEWPGGGKCVNPADWYSALVYYLSGETRAKDGTEGRRYAESRDMLTLGDFWKETIEGVITSKD